MFVRFGLVFLIALVAWAAFVRPSEATGPERTYLVQPADTLWAIAVRNYAGDPRKAVWEIRERNALDEALIRPGQRLILP